MFQQKVEDSVNVLKMTTAEENAYARLMRLFQAPISDIVEAFNVLIFTEDNEQQLVDGATNQIVNIDDVLSTEIVFVLLSGLYITQEEISYVKEAICEVCDEYEEYTTKKRRVIERKKCEEQYPILWIPIADKWDVENKSNFDKRRPKVPANWYIAKYVSSKTSTIFIKNEWRFDSRYPKLLMIKKGNVFSIPLLGKRQCSAQSINSFPLSPFSSGSSVPLQNSRNEKALVKNEEKDFMVSSSAPSPYRNKEVLVTKCLIESINYSNNNAMWKSTAVPENWSPDLLKPLTKEYKPLASGQKQNNEKDKPSTSDQEPNKKGNPDGQVICIIL